MNAFDIVLLFGAGLLGGAINALAGGGTLVTFPALLSFDVGSKLANTTSQVALWPGRVTSVAAQFRDLEAIGRGTVTSFIIAFAGGLAGAWLLLVLPETLFRTLVPWLLLLATLLFALSRQIQRAIGGRRYFRSNWLPIRVFGRLCEFAACVYGGFFGAGLGVILMAGYALAGMQDLRQANALKNLINLLITSVSALTFILRGEVVWLPAIVMLLGALLGGYGGGRLARHIPDRPMRIAVTAAGLFLAAYYFVRS